MPVGWRSRLTVLEMHLDGRAVGGLAHPGVEILAFSSLEEENIVAVVQFRQFIELI